MTKAELETNELFTLLLFTYYRYRTKVHMYTKLSTVYESAKQNSRGINNKFICSTSSRNKPIISMQCIVPQLSQYANQCSSAVLLWQWRQQLTKVLLRQLA